ncbi:MAG TPA: indolepyruvate ferredoxin oxidoreductase subunit alpha [Peptococcaceae bacterium]|nr:MAG: Indolepyruvate ferredoxin oxidoreductase, alpha subunit [Clostridia bacterium 41_269]HBT20905.1 indolepyruvate ferredoxin oxidoreductase subunit alpha [Peptococcaceae bacterium]
MQKLLTGNEAVARGAYEAGVHFASAYPGTPSTEILENLAKYEEIDAQWSPNEKVALEVALGASIGGARSIVSMKHVGLNVAADPLFTASYTGVNGGLVIVSADDPGMYSSQDEQDNRYYARFAKIPMLEPSDSQEAKDFTAYAFELSEEYDTPVLLRLTTRISHGRSPVILGERIERNVKDYNRNIEKYIVLPAHARKLHIKVEERMSKLRDLAEKSPFNEVQMGDREIGIITCGAAYQYVKEACPNASILKLGFSYPVPHGLIKEFSRQVKRLIVVEELEPLLENEIRALGIKVEGKELFTRFGELSTEIVRKGLGMEEQKTAEPVENIPLRPPVLCPGCPHRGVFYQLNRLKAVVTGDIGCYTLGALPPLSSMDTCHCMGASIGAALGLEKARGKEFARKVVAVIGDSTFLHSGITGLMDVVYNKGTITVVILDNGTTAMTGHQHHPGTGYTAKNMPTSKVDLENICRAVGVKRVVTVDPYDLESVGAVLKEEMAVEEPSVVISRRPCVLMLKEKESAFAVGERCIGCGACVRLGCPAVSMKGAAAEINIQLCSGCGLCAQVCPNKAIEKK